MFEVNCSDDGEHRVIRPVGDVSLASIPRLSDALARELASATTNSIVIDLDGSEAIDDAGLGILIGFASRVRSTGRSITVVASLPRITRRLEETRFDRAVDVTSSILKVSARRK